MVVEPSSPLWEAANLSSEQRALVERPIGGAVFLEGPAGAGKTTVGVARLLRLLNSGRSARSILVFVPQRTLGIPYHVAAQSPCSAAHGEVTLLTLGALAQRMVDLFWPLVAEEAGFRHPERGPTFLTLETAQYYMARVVRPMLEEGGFESVTIDRNRLYSQILDNLNKSAVVGFPYTQIGDRLAEAWAGEESGKRIYEEAQVGATRFRRYCLDNNLLDFSLQVDLFRYHLWTRPICREYLLERYRHLIVDNVEEDVPVAHDLLREWVPAASSVLMIYDRGAGYRRFLGADPESGYALRALCDDGASLQDSFVMRPEMEALGETLTHSLRRRSLLGTPAREARTAMAYEPHRYHPEMLDWVTGEIATLVHERDVAPGEVVVLAPYLSDALRFSLANRLDALDIPTRSHRPSRALREESATHCLLTLATIAHPAWRMPPERFDVAYALMQAIEGMDLVRAQLLAEIVYRVRDGAATLGSFDEIKPRKQERLTYVLGERYERLRAWIAEYVDEESGASAQRRAVSFDHFLSRLFGEVLSQPGYGFHRDFDAAEVAANLIESVRKFRWAIQDAGSPEGRESSGPISLGQEYVEMVHEGVIAAQYVRSWQLELEDAVLLAPAYTFIIRNRPVDYQFWLNVGGRGWWERLYQPLTHPYVLSRHWPPDDGGGATWTDQDEVQAREEALLRLTRGLIRRCRRRIYLGFSSLGEQGFEQKGPLLQAFQRILRHLLSESAG